MSTKLKEVHMVDFQGIPYGVTESDGETIAKVPMSAWHVIGHILTKTLGRGDNLDRIEGARLLAVWDKLSKDECDLSELSIDEKHLILTRLDIAPYDPIIKRQLSELINQN